MNDNLKTWPEHIRLIPRTDGKDGDIQWMLSTEFFPSYQEYSGRASWQDILSEIPEGTAEIKYIREDIAKEREIHEDEAFEIGYNKGIVDTAEKIKKQFQSLKLDPNLKYIEGETAKKCEIRLIEASYAAGYKDGSNGRISSLCHTEIYKSAKMEELK